MSRLLLLIAIVAVIYLLIRAFRKDKSLKDKKITEDMVCCAHCGVHLPKGESIEADRRFFCSTEHRDGYRDR